MDNIRVNLPQSYQLHPLSGQSREQLGTVGQNVFASVPAGKAQIQHALPIGQAFKTTLTAGPRRETMYEQRQLRQRRDLDNLQIAREERGPCPSDATSKVRRPSS